jgi:ribosomal protein S18 acetylase RimI-like enzyme
VGPQIIVREAGDGDALLLAELTRAAWANKVTPASSGHDETPAQVLAHLREGGGVVLEVDGTPAGSARWLPVDGEPNVWVILRIGVLPAFRGTNLSQHLVEAVIHQGQARGIAELRLAVRADQPKLLDFYTALGFALAPELEYAHGNPAQATPWVMRKNLNA